MNVAQLVKQNKERHRKRMALRASGGRVALATGGTPDLPDAPWATDNALPDAPWDTSKPTLTAGEIAMDVAKSGGIGVAKGVIGLAGLPGDIGSLAKNLTSAVANKFGVDETKFSQAQKQLSDIAKNVPLVNTLTGPGSDDIQKTIEQNVTGPFYKPKSVPGEYSQTVGEFLPAAAMGPGRLATRALTQVAIPAVGAETATQLTKGTDAEPYARIAGAFAAPLAASVAARAALPVMAHIAPQRVADAKLAQALKRAEMTPQDLLAELKAAGMDNQGLFTVADALGPAGQRMLAGTTRQPHDARTAAIDFLEARQAGQSRRVSSTLADAFDTPDTAAQRAAVLTADRTATSNVNYDAARNVAVPVDVTGAITKADDLLRPGASKLMRPASDIADTSIESQVRKAKSFLTDGKSQISDFKSAFDAKAEIDHMIENAKPSLQRILIPIRNALDDALIKASGPYRHARDTHHQMSLPIEAIPVGKAAATRGRFEDTIPAFQKMTPAQQTAFRVGYADPLIEDAQRAAPGSNTARALTSHATAQEFPAFAGPGKGDQLLRRIDRENTMFSTRNQALGGSRTADNIADMNDVRSISPEVFFNLLHGNYLLAGKNAASRLLSEAGGMSPGVAARVSEALLERDPFRLMERLRKIETTSKRARDNIVIRHLMRGAVAAASTPHQ